MNLSALLLDSVNFSELSSEIKVVIAGFAERNNDFAFNLGIGANIGLENLEKGASEYLAQLASRLPSFAKGFTSET
jgi:hypothetical protein